MRLKRIFDEQKRFQKNFYDPDSLTYKEKIKYTKEFVLSIHKELSEILDTIPWKLHRKEEVLKSKNNTIEEIIDCFKFLLNLCIVWGVDDRKFVNEFYRKTLVVKQRYQQEILKTIKKDDLVCALDLDNTLSESDEHFIKIYNKEYKTSFSSREEIKKTLNTLDYENFKSYYRESGEKINIPLKKDAKKLCDFLKKKKYKIVIISARPYKKHFRIFSDTLEWLRKNKIKYDAIYFDENKHLKILKQLPNLSFIVEDNSEYAKQIAEQKIKVYLLTDKKIKNKYIEPIKNLNELFTKKIK